MSTVKWPTEHDDALKKHHATGLSFLDISVALNNEFQTSYSRNAAIGRAGRMGLTFKKEKPKERAPRENKRRLQLIKTSAVNNNQRFIETVESDEPFAIRCVEVEPRNLTLLELEPDDCRYPYGDGPFVFCGKFKLDGSSYCPDHFRLTQGHTLTLTDAERQRRRQHFADIKRSA